MILRSVTSLPILNFTVVDVCRKCNFRLNILLKAMEDQQNKKFQSVDQSTTIQIIETFGEQFYDAKFCERATILEHIVHNLSLHGKFYSVEDIHSKLLNLRRSYNKYRKDLENGQEIKWKYFATLDNILRNKCSSRKRTLTESFGSPMSQNFKIEPDIELTEFEDEITPR